MRRIGRSLLVLVIAGLAVGVHVRAEDVYASLHGTVTDVSGAVIQDATVTVVNVSTGIRSVRSADSAGYFSFPQLQVGGPYRVTVAAPGFVSFVERDLTLHVNDNREVNARLAVSGDTQTVIVKASALQVETANTQLQQIATAEQLESIPLEGRDPAGLQKLEPGIVESSDRFGTFASNGSQTAQNSYMVDGVDINDPELENEGIQVNPDALAEVNIVTSTMNPEFARDSGAVVNQVLKSGTNDLHGSAFEFYRDTFLNNGDYFSTARPVFHQNLYGGTVGGPVVRNKVFFFAAYQGLRNRTAQTELQTTLNTAEFGGDFSADTNYASGASNSAGLSSNPIPFNIGSCVANPNSANPETWSQCFAAGPVSIPASQWNPIAASLIKKYVLPANENLGGVAYANFAALNSAAQDQGILRIELTPTAHDSLWASSIFQSSPGTSALTFTGASFPGFGSEQANHFKLFSASWTHVFGANMLNELHASYYRNPWGVLEPAQVVAPSSVGFDITPQDSASSLPYMTVGSFFNLGFSYEGPQPRLSTNLTFADNLMWVRGGHTIKFGGQFEQFRVRNPFDAYNNGFFAFEGGTEGGGVYSSGDPVIDFALGIPDIYMQSNDGLIDAVASELFAYAQDNWKLSHDFTFNYGLAWDVERPNQNRQDGGLGIICWQNTNSTSNIFPGAPPGLSWPGDAGCNAAGSPTAHYDHFAPRVGLAWSPSRGPSLLSGGAHNFSLRSGFGVYYNRDQEEQSLQNLEDPPFFFVSQGVSQMGGSPSFANPYVDVAGNGSMPNPFPYAPFKAGAQVDWDSYLPLQLAAFAPSSAVPTDYNYNLNAQRAIGGKMIAQLGYVGAVGRRLATWYEGDNITPAGHTACLASAMCLANPGSIHILFPQFTAQPVVVPGNPFGLPNGTPYYISVAEQATEGTSGYNALQASLIKALSHGLQFTLAYTWAHSIDDGSGYESAVGRGGRLRNYVPGFAGLNRGNSDFDARHRVAASYVYSIPVAPFMRSNALLRETVSGWKIAGVTALETGFPIEIYQTSKRSLWCDGYSYFGCADVPETTTARPATLDVRSGSHAYFDTTPFSDEPLGAFGNTPRNSLHGPGFDYTNLQLSKNIHLPGEGRSSLQLRIEAFNAFNHANFANPSGNFNSGSFGRVTSVVQSADPNGDPSPGRAVQLAGRVYF